jgi:Tol biopolymer transport system component
MRSTFFLLFVLVSMPARLAAQAASPAPKPPEPAPKTVMEAPKLPPFAGSIVNFDRRGSRVVACVDRATASKPGQPATPAVPAAPASGGPRQTRIWVIENEVMQELLTTSGLCDPAWSPDAKTFAAAGARGVFTFTQPNYEVKVIVAGQASPQPEGQAPARSYTSPVWSPSGRRLAFLVTAPTGAALQVVDVSTGERVFERPQAAKTLAWGGNDKTLIVDGTSLAIP